MGMTTPPALIRFVVLRCSIHRLAGPDPGVLGPTSPTLNGGGSCRAASREAAARVTAAAAAKPQGTAPSAPPPPPAGWATPEPPSTGPRHGRADLLGTAVQAAGELASIGLAFGGQAVKQALSRLPRP